MLFLVRFNFTCSERRGKRRRKDCRPLDGLEYGVVQEAFFPPSLTAVFRLPGDLPRPG